MQSTKSNLLYQFINGFVICYLNFLYDGTLFLYHILYTLLWFTIQIYVHLRHVKLLQLTHNLYITILVKMFVYNSLNVYRSSSWVNNSINSFESN